MGVPVAEIVEVTATDRGIKIDKVWVAADVGRVLDPVTFQAQMEGGVPWGLRHAMDCELPYAGGGVEQTTYKVTEGMRLYQRPKSEARRMGKEASRQCQSMGAPAI